MASIDLKKVLIGAVAIVVIAGGIFLAVKPKKVLVVDIDSVVTSYDKAINIEKEIDLKEKDLTKFLEEAKTEIGKAKTAEERAALDEKYTSEYNKKAMAIADFNKTEVKKVRDDIQGAVRIVAKKKTGFSSTVVYERRSLVVGGVDITEDVKNVLNKK